MSFFKKLFGSSEETKTKTGNNIFIYSDENMFIKKCSEFEFVEEAETRKWNSDPSFANVLNPFNNRQFDVTIKEGKKIVSKFNDFDILYHWIGVAYRETSLFEQSNNILVDGLIKSKRKCLLLIDLAETAWRLNALDHTIYYLSQALHSSTKVEEYNTYLLLHYIAKGMDLETEANSFLQKVDNLKGGNFRMKSEDAQKLIALAKKSSRDSFKKVISELYNKYLKPAEIIEKKSISEMVQIIQDFGIFIDPRDEEKYKTIQIGNQIWMAENMRTTKYNDGSPISDDWTNPNTPAYCWYDNNKQKKDEYGALYNWHALNTGKFTPNGWHLPTDEEWEELKNYLIKNGYSFDKAIDSNKIAKSLAAKTGWKLSNETGTVGNDLLKNNLSGFSALPGGCRGLNGKFFSGGNEGIWWSLTERDQDSAFTWGVGYGFGHLYNSGNDKNLGLSVRLLKDHGNYNIEKTKEKEFTINEIVEEIIKLYDLSPKGQGFVTDTPEADKVREYGDMLNKSGGMKLMQIAHAMFREKRAFAARNLEMVWSGIGNWRG